MTVPPPMTVRPVKALFGVDEFYRRTIVDPLSRLAEFGLWKKVDGGVVEGIVNGAGAVARKFGAAVAALQSGSIQTYLTWMVAGALALLLLLLT